MKFPSVDGWFVLDIFARERLAAFLSNQYIAKSKSSPVEAPAKAVVKASFTKNILQEAELWGVNVAPDVRYYYSSRNAARKSDLAHQVCVNGRVR